MSDYRASGVCEGDGVYHTFKGLVDTKLRMIRQSHVLSPGEKRKMRENIDALGKKINDFSNYEDLIRRYSRESRTIG